MSMPGADMRPDDGPADDDPPACPACFMTMEWDEDEDRWVCPFAGSHDADPYA